MYKVCDAKKQKLTDDCVGYGSYVVECIAKLDPRTHCIDQHQMNTVLCRVQLGTLFPSNSGFNPGILD